MKREREGCGKVVSDKGLRVAVSVHLAKRYILCFVDVVGSFFKLFCCLLQNYTKTMHVDEDGNVDDVDVEK